MVETPPALEAARRLCHAPGGNQQGENLPARAMKIFDGRKAGEPQATEECAQRQDNGADQRSLPQAKDVGAEKHNLSMYSAGVGRGGRGRLRGPTRI